MIQAIAHWIALHGYGIIFGVFAGGVIGVPVPNDLLLGYLGYFIYSGKLLPLPTVTAAYFGCIFGMTVNYLLGRAMGFYFVHKYAGRLRLNSEQLSKIRTWFGHAGKWGLLFSNFIPGIRHLAPIVAGASKMSFTEFAFFSFSGTLIWTVLYISLGYFLGEEWKHQTAVIHNILGGVSIAVVAVFVLYQLWRGKKRRAEV